VVTGLRGEGFEGRFRALIAVVRVGGGNFAAAFEHVGVQAAALLGPLVGLLGEHCADQAQDRVAVRKIPTTSVRRRISLFSRSCGCSTRRSGAVRNKVRARVIPATRGVRAAGIWVEVEGSGGVDTPARRGGSSYPERSWGARQPDRPDWTERGPGLSTRVRRNCAWNCAAPCVAQCV
jgi:hypothetical protein